MQLSNKVSISIGGHLSLLTGVFACELHNHGNGGVISSLDGGCKCVVHFDFKRIVAE
jgi:hypothetical protein